MNYHNNGNGRTSSADSHKSSGEQLDKIKPVKINTNRPAKEHHRKELVATLKKRDIIREVIPRDPDQLKPHDINQVLYGDETVDLSAIPV